MHLLEVRILLSDIHMMRNWAKAVLKGSHRLNHTENPNTQAVRSAIYRGHWNRVCSPLAEPGACLISAAKAMLRGMSIGTVSHL